MILSDSVEVRLSGPTTWESNRPHTFLSFRGFLTKDLYRYALASVLSLISKHMTLDK